MYYYQYESPIGKIDIIADDNTLLGVAFEETKNKIVIKKDYNTIKNEIIEKTVYQLDQYFDGKLKEFSLLYSISGTDFEIDVWKQIDNIPYSETITYGEIAKNIGKPNSSRAVGTAVGKNPIAIIIPCHRVLPKTGGIGNYDAGTKRKGFLLNLENN